MSAKSPAYWAVHKKILQKSLDELDLDMRDRILKNSESLDAIRFNDRVNMKVKKELDLKLDR